jgi:hypothetical protein
VVAQVGGMTRTLDAMRRSGVVANQFAMQFVNEVLASKVCCFGQLRVLFVGCLLSYSVCCLMGSLCLNACTRCLACVMIRHDAFCS